MTAYLDLKLAHRRAVELRGAAAETRFTLRGHHLAKLDRFLGQAQRAALAAGREFEGLSIEVDAQGAVMVHAVGMTPIRL